MSTAENYQRFRGDISQLLADLGKFLGDLVEAPQGEDCQERKPFDEKQQHWWNAYYKLRRRHDDESLSVAVLALTKSGKSTLLNSFMGAEFLPVNNVPETARISKIVHTPSASCRDAVMEEGPTTYTGCAAIRARLQELNDRVRSREQPQSPPGGEEQVLLIRACIAALDQEAHSDTKLVLLDTPGPNEAGEEGLKYQVERLLDGVDAVIYLMDYTKLKTSEEAAIFARLKAINPQLVDRLSQRLFFVVNKADQLHQCQGMDERETQEYVAELVTKQLASEAFQLHPDQVLLVSAKDALMARLVASGRATETMQRSFMQIAFGRRPPSRAPPADEIRRAAEDILEQSGVVELEERILSYLYCHGGAVKLLATVDDIVRVLQEMRNVALSTQAALQANVEELVAQAEGLQKEVAEVLADFDYITADTQALQGEVTDELRRHLSNLRSRLVSYIYETLDCDVSAPNGGAGSSTGEASGSGVRPMGGGPFAQHAGSSTAAPSKWKLIRDRFVGLFSGGGGGSSGASSLSKDYLCNMLLDLHDDLMAQIQQEVGDFWHILEVCTNARHAQLVGHINRHLDQLSRRIEKSVMAQLQVRLEAVDISVKMPSSEEFHSDLTALISRGITERKVQHVRVNQREVNEREYHRGHGLCRWAGGYWTDVPRTRTVVEKYHTTMYQVEPQEIIKHFVDMVDSAVDNTQRALSSYVRAYIEQQLTAAREQIAQYGERYLDTMTVALDTRHQGQAAREAALQRLTVHLGQVDLMRGRVAELQQQAEALVPHNSTAGVFEQLEYPDDGYMSGQEDAELLPTQAATAAAVAGTSAAAAAAAAAAEEQGDADVCAALVHALTTGSVTSVEHARPTVPAWDLAAAAVNWRRDDEGEADVAAAQVDSAGRTNRVHEVAQGATVTPAVPDLLTDEEEEEDEHNGLRASIPQLVTDADLSSEDSHSIDEHRAPARGVPSVLTEGNGQIPDISNNFSDDDGSSEDASDEDRTSQEEDDSAAERGGEDEDEDEDEDDGRHEMPGLLTDGDSVADGDDDTEPDSNSSRSDAEDDTGSNVEADGDREEDDCSEAGGGGSNTAGDSDGSSEGHSDYAEAQGLGESFHSMHDCLLLDGSCYAASEPAAAAFATQAAAAEPPAEPLASLVVDIGSAGAPPADRSGLTSPVSNGSSRQSDLTAQTATTETGSAGQETLADNVLVLPLSAVASQQLPPEDEAQREEHVDADAAGGYASITAQSADGDPHDAHSEYLRSLSLALSHSASLGPHHERLGSGATASAEGEGSDEWTLVEDDDDVQL